MYQSQSHEGSCFGRHGSPAASLSGRDISNQRPNSVSSLSDFIAASNSPGSISASYWNKIVFFSLYLRLSATSSRNASTIHSCEWLWWRLRTKLTTFMTMRGFFAMPSGIDASAPATHGNRHTAATAAIQSHFRIMFFFMPTSSLQ